MHRSPHFAWTLFLLCAWPAFAQAPSEAPTSSLQEAAEQERQFLAGRRQASLKEVLALADKNSADLAAARAAARQVAAKSQLVYSAVLPELSMSASLVHTSAEQSFDFAAFAPVFEGAIGAAIYGTAPAYGMPMAPNPEVVSAISRDFTEQLTANAEPTVLVARNSLYGTVLLQQVLFAPHFFLLPTAGHTLDAAEYGSLEAREQILLAVARVYLGIEGLEQLEQAARDAEKVALKREREASAQAAAGVATDIAVLRAQSETAQARTVLANLAGQRMSLVAMLEALVGEPVRPTENATTQVEIRPSAEADLPWAQTYLVRSNQAALRAQEQVGVYDAVSWLPTVVAQAKGGYNSNKGFADTNWVFDGILAAQWTLYDRGMKRAEANENAAKRAEQYARLEGAKAKARAHWIGAKRNLQAAQVALEQAEAQATLAARAQKQVEAAVQAGFSTSLEQSDIDNKRFLAASSAANARAQLQIRKVELAAAEGRLATLMGLAEAP